MRSPKHLASGLLCLVLLGGCDQSGSAPLPADAPVGAAAADGMLPNSAFLPGAGAAPAHASFEGTLQLAAAEMSTNPAQFAKRMMLDRDTQLFPGVSLSFFTHGDHLVPVDRDLIRVGSLKTGGSYWDIFVFPGRVWSEPADGAWSRASFGFALTNPLEGETHNGVAMFLYDGDEVSDLRYQIVTLTSPFYVEEFFEAWGQLQVLHDPAPIHGVGALQLDYADELADKLPTLPWDELGLAVGPEALEGSDTPVSPQDIIALALVRDGVLYRSPCYTPFGELPYCDDQRFGIWSASKTALGAVSMLALAQKYGPEVFDLPILDYIDAAPPHNGWDGVTVGDALNMATGLGEGSEVIEPNENHDGYLVRYDEWYPLASRDDKVAAILTATDHPWGPGEVFRYRDQDMFLVGVVGDAYVKEQEGPDASLWEFLADEVYRPIGVRHPVAGLTLEPDGSIGVPLMQGPLWSTLEYLARIAALMQNHGEYEGRQILHRERLAELMYETPTRGLPYGSPTDAGIRTYHMATWYLPFDAGEDCEVELPYMSGWGGQRVLMLPNGIATIRIARQGGRRGQALASPSVPAALAHAMRPLCS